MMNMTEIDEHSDRETLTAFANNNKMTQVFHSQESQESMTKT